MAYPSVSVIVPAHNAEATLAECLRALQDQTVLPAEFIIFLDGSTDGSERIAGSAGVKILRNDGRPRGPAYGRNAAAAVAQSELLWFVDADVVVDPNCLRNLLDDMQAHGAEGAFGSYDDRPASHRATSLYANLRHHFVHQHGDKDATTFWSGIGLIRRDRFLQFGGFDFDRFPHPSVEDVDLGMRLVAAGHRIRLVPSALGKHCKDWSLWRVWHTDVVRRARPWAILLSERRTSVRDLNLTLRERAKALLALLILPLLAASWFNWLFAIPAATVAVAYCLANRDFFSFLARRISVPAFAVAVGMHWCYHCYSAMKYAFTMVQLRLTRVMAGAAAAPKAARPNAPSVSDS